MNKNIIKSFAAFIPVLSLMACSENEWNDKYLDGFEGGPSYSSASSGSYTLTADDYATISSLMLEIAITDEEIAAANAIKTNLYFDATSPYPATVALPYFIASTSSPFFNFSNGSTANISYQEISGVPEELTAISTAYTFRLTSETSVEDLPDFLAGQYPDAEEGDFAIVSYLPATETKAATRAESSEESISVLTVSEAIELMANGFEGEANVIGVISKINDLSTSFGNATYFIQDTLESEESLEIYRGYSLNGDKFTTEDEIEVGGTVVVSGSLTIYNGTYEFTTGSSILYYYSEEVWSVAQALAKIAEGSDIEDAVVRGVVSQIDDISTSYGNGTYWIKDNLNDDTALEIYRGYFINGDKFTSTDQIAVGGSIIVSGKLTEYNGTSEFTTGSKVINYFPSANMVDPSLLLNALFYFNGTEWTPATGAAVLDPNDYSQMGFSNNDLTDPQTYIPLYLKNNYPYALEGDEMYVAYNVKTNTCSCGLFIFDGSVWEQNNDGLEDLTGLFTKSKDEWSFTKYIGKAVYNIFNENEIELDRSYMFVSGTAAATPVPAGSSYGYLLKTDVSPANGVIELPNDDNAFLFATTFDYEGETYEVPEDQFLIRDSHGNYLYMTGTYTSFNIKASPLLNGAISSEYLFTAKNNGDGTWKVTNTNGKSVFFSSGYSNFAGYESQGTNDSYPSLYILQ